MNELKYVRSTTFFVMPTFQEIFLVGKVGTFGSFFLLEVVLKIYCWEANPNFHEPWKETRR